MMSSDLKPLIGLVMGSRSDWDVLQHAANTLDSLALAYEVKIVSAHRTPDQLFEYAETASARGLNMIIAGAGGAAHLPGMLAAKTALPILGVPIPSTVLQGMDALMSIVQMPAGVPVATFALGRAGAVNAALFAAAVLSLNDLKLQKALDDFRRQQTQAVLDHPDPRLGPA